MIISLRPYTRCLTGILTDNPSDGTGHKSKRPSIRLHRCDLRSGNAEKTHYGVTISRKGELTTGKPAGLFHGIM